MSDFRKAYYERYVSTFKNASAKPTDWPVEAYWQWCRYKYMPFLAGVPADAPILELGCGAGQLLELLKNSGFSKAQGIDVSAEQVERAAARGLRAEVADAFDFLQSRENTYAAIVAVDFIEHFTKEELLELVPLIYRALSEGGVFILQTPNGQGLFSHQVIYGDLTHLTVFTPGSLAQLLRLFGFEKIVLAETGPVPKNLKGKIRLALWTLVKVCLNTLRRIETGKRQDIWTESLICACRKPLS